MLLDRGGGMCKPGVAVATPELLPGCVILAIFGDFWPFFGDFATPETNFRYP